MLCGNHRNTLVKRVWNGYGLTDLSVVRLVFASKVAKNANGVPIQAEGSTATNPVYQTLEGPATMTSSTGNTIVMERS